MCVCSCVRLNKNEEFILFRFCSLSFGCVLAVVNEEDFIFIIFTSNLSKVFQNDKRKNFQKHTHFTTTQKQTHTHTDILERKTPHERRRQREEEKMTTTTRRRRKPVG